MSVISKTFSLLGSTRAKFLLSSPSGVDLDAWSVCFRSLTIEYVSAAELIRRESGSQALRGSGAQRAHSGPCLPDEALTAAVKKWFWSRSSAPGFVLEGFPQTLLQARIFDEWLEARGESLAACLYVDAHPGGCLSPVARHYDRAGQLVVLPLGDPAGTPEGLATRVEPFLSGR